MAPPAPAPRVKFSRSLFGWILFIGLAVMLFFVLKTQDRVYKSIPLSEFIDRLEDKQIGWIRLEENEISGRFLRPQTLADGSTGRDFRTHLPAGMGADWGFVQHLLEKSRGNAVVEARAENNLLVNILLPIIPWLLIFGFIWFFVFRQLRKANAAQPAVAGPAVAVPTVAVTAGPGRWVPDEPGKAGQA